MAIYQLLPRFTYSKDVSDEFEDKKIDSANNYESECKFDSDADYKHLITLDERIMLRKKYDQRSPFSDFSVEAELKAERRNRQMYRPEERGRKDYESRSEYDTDSEMEQSYQRSRDHFEKREEMEERRDWRRGKDERNDRNERRYRDYGRFESERIRDRKLERDSEDEQRYGPGSSKSDPHSQWAKRKSDYSSHYDGDRYGSRKDYDQSWQDGSSRSGRSDSGRSVSERSKSSWRERSADSSSSTRYLKDDDDERKRDYYSSKHQSAPQKLHRIYSAKTSPCSESLHSRQHSSSPANSSSPASKPSPSFSSRSQHSPAGERIRIESPFVPPFTDDILSSFDPDAFLSSLISDECNDNPSSLGYRASHWVPNAFTSNSCSSTERKCSFEERSSSFISERPVLSPSAAVEGCFSPIPSEFDQVSVITLSDDPTNIDDAAINVQTKELSEIDIISPEFEDDVKILGSGKLRRERQKSKNSKEAEKAILPIELSSDPEEGEIVIEEKKMECSDDKSIENTNLITMADNEIILEGLDEESYFKSPSKSISDTYGKKVENFKENKKSNIESTNNDKETKMVEIDNAKDIE
eukprot:MONOS_10704.1-p1 / transcript=MONOS_10704.1 / gene=MONOS_10704 / organism=Monocercomonoides_exilis_PA203 / gene_product=unspecified product / transcript_product=unspecified product / location=Mono_scaffold00496:42691-44442(+) / protein_length=584 / sequence_SO=supercontig / SO=protein_coding / is_pseudo=false